MDDKPFDGFSAMYDRGRAYGVSHIKTDTMTFRFRDELFEFPTMKVHHLARYNGYFWEAEIGDIRKLKAELAAEVKE